MGQIANLLAVFQIFMLGSDYIPKQGFQDFEIIEKASDIHNILGTVRHP